MNSISDGDNGKGAPPQTVKRNDLSDRVAILEKLAAKSETDDGPDETRVERLERRAKNTSIGLVVLGVLFIVGFLSDVLGLIAQVRKESDILEQSSLEERLVSAKRAYLDGFFLSAKGRFEALANEALQKTKLQENVTEFLSAAEASRLLSDAADLCAKHALDSDEEQRKLLLRRLSSVIATANELFPYDTKHVPLLHSHRCFRVNQQSIVDVSELRFPVAFREQGPLGEEIDFALKKDGSIVFLNNWIDEFTAIVDLELAIKNEALPDKVRIYKHMEDDFKAVLAGMESRGLIEGITHWHGTMNPRLPSHFARDVESVRLRAANKGTYFSFSEMWRSDDATQNQADYDLNNLDLLFFEYCFDRNDGSFSGGRWRSYDWTGPKKRPYWEPCIGV